MQAGSPVPRLEVTSVSKSFAGRPVVSGMSLDIMPDQTKCLLGPSGCGKSTSLRMIAGIERQDSGKIRISGRTVADDRVHVPPESRSVGMMFQDFALFPHLTVEQNVAFGLGRNDPGDTKRVGELLERVHMEAFRASYPHELSGGEQQRVALARALAPSPGILLMDEPFSSLDDRLRDGIRDETMAVLKQEGTSVLLVTHDPDEAMRMADEIILMRDGRVVQRGGPYAIYSNPVDREAAAFLSDINLIEGTVMDSHVQTLFGLFPAGEIPEGQRVHVVIRPHHLRLDFDRGGNGPLPTAEEGIPVRGLVKRVRFLGQSSLIEFRMDLDRSAIKVTMPGVFLPPHDTPFWLSMRRDRCFVFPVDDEPSPECGSLPASRDMVNALQNNAGKEASTS